MASESFWSFCLSKGYTSLKIHQGFDKSVCYSRLLGIFYERLFVRCINKGGDYSLPLCAIIPEKIMIIFLGFFLVLKLILNNVKIKKY